MKLHELVFSARTAGRYAEAICLAQSNASSSDGWLAGASHFEASNAWESLGCHVQAVAEIEASLQVRPRGRSGWKETCDWCAKIHGQCDVCSRSFSRVPCPSNEQLVHVVGPAMLSQAPSGASWSTPSVVLCTPIALPAAGWYVVAQVQQETPDRDFRFALAVDAGTRAVVASSEGEQRSIRDVCDVKIGKVADRAGAPSSVFMRENCVDKMGHESSNSFDVTIAPPRVLVRAR